MIHVTETGEGTFCVSFIGESLKELRFYDRDITSEERIALVLLEGIVVCNGPDKLERLGIVRGS